MKKLLLSSLCAVLAACAPMEPADATTAPAQMVARSKPAAPSHPPANVVTYLGELRAMNETALTREIARQRQLLSREGSDLARTRLAAALSLSPAADDAEIAGLVEPVARRETAAADVRAVASFLQAMANERRRLRESAATANARVREERKMADAQKQRADTLQERVSQLQQKLDALSELEKSLSDRPNTNR